MTKSIIAAITIPIINHSKSSSIFILFKDENYDVSQT
jgi:hypothetical protein